MEWWFLAQFHDIYRPRIINAKKKIKIMTYYKQLKTKCNGFWNMMNHYGPNDLTLTVIKSDVSSSAFPLTPNTGHNGLLSGRVTFCLFALCLLSFDVFCSLTYKRKQPTW